MVPLTQIDGLLFVLVCTVGYFNRLKNQSDPLSRQVAINIDSNTQVRQLVIP